MLNSECNICEYAQLLNSESNICTAKYFWFLCPLLSFKGHAQQNWLSLNGRTDYIPKTKRVLNQDCSWE